jgi:hypothetical protein
MDDDGKGSGATFSWSDDDALAKLMAEMQAADDEIIAIVCEATERWARELGEALAEMEAIAPDLGEILAEPPVIVPGWLN